MLKDYLQKPTWGELLFGVKCFLAAMLALYIALRLGLPRPFYRLELDAAGLSVWMAGEQNKTEPTNRYTWNTVYCAYRTKEAVYIYVQKNQAYLLNESMDAAWSLLSSVLPAASLHDCRK